jgi:hypothetical protein
MLSDILILIIIMILIIRGGTEIIMILLPRDCFITTI